MDKIKSLFLRYKELIVYGIFGVLTTAVNYVSYIIFTRAFGLGVLASNLIAWVLAVAFAFVTNKLFVFESKKFEYKILVKELVSFVISRVFSLALDMAILYVMHELMHINDLIVKIISNVVIIIVNYVISKFIIFKDKK